MKRFALFAIVTFFLFLRVQSAAAAGGIVHIADGDCAGLSAAAGAAPGQEPGLIVLAPNGHYACMVSIEGDVAIEGSGATWALSTSEYDTCGHLFYVPVSVDGRLTVRNINFVPLTQGTASRANSSFQPKFCHPAGDSAAIVNNGGTLVLDSASLIDLPIGDFSAEIQNYGKGTLVLRNVTVKNTSGRNGEIIYAGGLASNVVITNSTLDLGAASLVRSDGVDSTSVSIANSIVVGGTGPLCNFVSSSGVKSLGGNLIQDGSCGFNAASDRIVNDAGLTDLGHHGGVVDSLALSYYSPAKGAGLAANCEATDARGVARGTDHCDAGAYEFGGGAGQLGASGMSGLYYDAAHDGHYVTVQRLDSGGALVIWNTFDESGTPAWLYGVGQVNGNMIHVAQVSQNLGGKLQPGGTVIGSKETIWGSFDFTAGSCAAATLAYNSPNAAFGSGSVNLTRLALVDGIDCSP